MYYSKIRRGEKHGRGENTNIVAQIPDKHCVRGEIYLANLEPVVGSEQGGIRPVVILQNNVGNKHSPTTIAAPITTKRVPNNLPIHVLCSRLVPVCRRTPVSCWSKSECWTSLG